MSKENNQTKEKTCFVIMPISDPDGYEQGHFKRVYENIFKPAIIAAGFKPERADDDKASNVIHIKIWEKLIHSDMVLCDLSARNPNVLYELGIRQAFDKPMVLVKDNVTGSIFDTDALRACFYDKSMRADLADKNKKEITTAIKETENDPKYNSIMSIMQINAASLNENTKIGEKDFINLKLNEISGQLSEIKRFVIKKDTLTEKRSKSFELQSEYSPILRRLLAMTDEEIERLDLPQLELYLRRARYYRTNYFDSLAFFDVVQLDSMIVLFETALEKKTKELTTAEN